MHLATFLFLSSVSVSVEKLCVQIPELCEVRSNSESLFLNIFTSSMLSSCFSKSSATICNYVIILSTVTAVFIS